MKISDAANILSLSGSITPEIIKTAYRKAAMKYHPDRNPAGVEMMKIVNAAYDLLKDYTGEIEQDEISPDDSVKYPDAVNEALNVIIGLVGLEIEICGVWLWVGGNTYPHKNTLKDLGFKFASKKKLWYFRPENWRSTSRGKFSMNDIRTKYGTITPNFERRAITV